MDDIDLIDIDVARDAPLAMAWINAPSGVEMLRLMGMIVPDDFTTTLDLEAKTLQQIINDPNELAWMIDYDGQVVGILEVHLVDQASRPAPNIGIMIGDASARGKGIGRSAIQLAISKLVELGYKTVYARTLTHNTASRKMLAKLGFVINGRPYAGTDNLHWQNYSLAISDIVAY